MSINGEEKFNLCNQISNGEERFNLYRCQQKKKKKKKKKKESDKKGKGVVVMEPEPENSNTEHMDDADEPMSTHFQEEILMDILKRLPVQSLLRFKCVSKFWGTLISKPYFKMKHLNHAKHDQNSQKFLISEVYPNDISPIYCCPLSSVQLVEDVQKLDYPSSFIPWCCTLHCCCDGLVIIQVIDNTPDKCSVLLLWNPSTRESIVLPNPEFLELGYCRLGLGYDSTIGDYKILKLHTNIRGHRESGEILTLKYGRWRNVDKHPLAFWNLLQDTFSLAMVHETFHWIIAIGEYTNVSNRKSSLVSFSISNEVYGEIPLPEQLLCPTRILRFGVSVLNEMLCVYSSCVCKLEAFKLWVLKDYGVKESWNVVFTIYDPLISDLKPKYWFADGKLLYWFRYVRSRETAFRTSDVPFVLWPQSGYFMGIAFTESLISPKSLTY